MITFIARKGGSIDFNGSVIDTLPAIPEETRAIVRKDDGKFALAYYCYDRFSNGNVWVIWTDFDYPTQFKAMMELDLAKPNARGWGIADEVKYVKV